MNKVVLIGRLTKDPELRSTQSGLDVASFTLAVDRRFKNKDGEKETDFIPVIAWRKTAELCAKYLSKGSQCAVSGSIQTRNYEDKDGIKRYMTKIIADEVSFLSTKQRNDDYEERYEEIDDLDVPF